jgi:hypothetical protein
MWNLGVDGTTILKWISDLYAVKVRVTFIWFSTGLMALSCAEVNGPPGSIKEGKFLDQLVKTILTTCNNSIICRPQMIYKCASFVHVAAGAQTTAKTSN